MEIPIIQTEHLLLRPWLPEDAEAWFNILQEKDILQYFPSQSPPGLDKADRYIAHHQAHWNKYTYGHWAVVNREDGLVVGWNGLEFLPELDQTEIAYLLSKRVHGRGYATEAARAAINYGFEMVGLAEVIGLVHPENSASIRVLEKCGMMFNDNISLWGMEMSRYRISRIDFSTQ